MLDKTQDIATGVANWLTEFEQALAAADAGGLRDLFHADSYWRDVLALSWRIRTLNGRDAILQAFPSEARAAAPHSFALAAERAPPHWVTRAGTASIEAIFRFETAQGRGFGLAPADSGSCRRRPAEGLDAAHRARRT